MFNLKWSIICAAAAFALALAASLLLGHTTLLVALLRAAIFAILFFGLGAAIWALINTFLPELLSPSAEGNGVSNVFSPEVTGSRINITVDDEPNANSSPALPEEKEDAPDVEGMGDFSDLITGSIKTAQDIDQNPSTGYTEGAEELPSVFGNVKLEETGDFSMDFGALVSDGEAGEELEELDAFSFLSDGNNSGNSEDFSAPERKSSGNKPAKLEGDFDPKEIAAGLRTVLEKDKKRG